MEIKRYEGTGRMSRAVVHNNTVYLCGQTCGDEDKGIKEQTKITLKKVEDLLNKYGSDKSHILSATLYIKDMSMFSEMNEIWDDWIEDGFEPARACVEAQMARESILFEISVIAAIK
ncbi:RidA family protein [Senegalia massiliensis]|uniref:RidA family protein n=1 Tax=Senegalia massiliensis TaxID=1720316 RepID=UPI00102F7893|nr:RidA family protein [Senegalia massiliensis]